MIFWIVKTGPRIIPSARDKVFVLSRNTGEFHKFSSLPNRSTAMPNCQRKFWFSVSFPFSSFFPRTRAIKPIKVWYFLDGFFYGAGLLALPVTVSLHWMELIEACIVKGGLLVNTTDCSSQLELRSRRNHFSTREPEPTSHFCWYNIQPKTSSER